MNQQVILAMCFNLLLVNCRGNMWAKSQHCNSSATQTNYSVSISNLISFNEIMKHQPSRLYNSQPTILLLHTKKQPVTTSDFSVKYSEAHSNHYLRCGWNTSRYLCVIDWESALMWQEFKLCEKGFEVRKQWAQKERFILNELCFLFVPIWTSIENTWWMVNSRKPHARENIISFAITIWSKYGPRCRCNAGSLWVGFYFLAAWRRSLTFSQLITFQIALT